MFDRTIALLGKEIFNNIQNKKILLIGLGGVGGYTLEALVRSGFTNITIVDYDNIDITNLNRQIITNINNIGNIKVLEAKKRALEINPKTNIIDINTCVDENNIENLLNHNYDYVIDACDTTLVKFLLMKYKNKYNYKLISSMGTAKKIDPTRLTITTLDKTSYDPLAKKLRNMIKKEKIKGKFYVVSSTEALKDNENILCSIITVPAVAGLYLVSYIINDLYNG